VTAFPLGSFTLRAYTHFPSPEKALSRTSTGTIPEPGRTIAVDPRVIPLGAKIYIEGLGERIAEDSGAKIKGKQIDVFLPSRDHCRRFGVQSRDVMVMIE
jgi:3D (Asp-Asp-Asp) domain-containing protein